MRLTRENLRRIILEELQQFNEEREVEAIMKRVLGEESWDTRNKYNDIHHAENLRDDERDEFEHGDVAAAEEDKHHEDDLYYDAHDDKEGEDHHHHRHSGHNEGRKLDEDDGYSWEKGLEGGYDSDQQQQNLSPGGEKMEEHLSRGSLYRKRYYGRY